MKTNPKPSFSMSEGKIDKLSDKYYSWGRNHTEEEFKKDLKDLLAKQLASQREKVVEEIREKFSKAFFTASFYATKKDMESLDRIVLENHMKLFFDSLSPNRRGKEK